MRRNVSPDEGDWTALARQSIAGVQLLTARFRKHSYARHAHDAYVLAVVDRGAQAFLYRGEKCVARAGNVVILAPGEAHDGRPHDRDGYVYRTLHIDPVWFADDRGALPHFPKAILRDETLRHALSAFCTELDEASEDQRNALEGVIATLCGRHAAGRSHLPEASHRAERALAGAAAEQLIGIDGGQPPTVGAVAAALGISRGHLSRLFLRTHGLPPHTWLLHRRLARALDQIRRGAPLAEVAVETGFVDQSHLTRRFKAVYGFTPGLLRALGSRRARRGG